MYNRLLRSTLLRSQKSILLLGPRQVGKSTLIHQLKPDLAINLANEVEYYTFQSNLDELERRIHGCDATSIFIDEIQRIPRLMNTIQAIIDKNPKLKFYLTGSSARKLRRGKANLLPGRVFSFFMTPLCLREMDQEWDDIVPMRFGTLPGVLNLKSDKDKKLLLSSYSSTYLKEEILAESLVRQVDGFVRFLQVSALESGRFLDISKMAKRAKVPRQSCVRHLEILEDTLIVKKVGNDPELDPDKVDLVKHSKFFFFDLGVLNSLRGSFEYNSERNGFLFEHLVFNQLSNSAAAQNLDLKLYNFRTRGGLEVDFIANLEGNLFAIECKASSDVTSTELDPIRKISSYYSKIKKIVIYRGQRELKDGDIWILPLQKALKVIGL